MIAAVLFAIELTAFHAQAQEEKKREKKSRPERIVKIKSPKKEVITEKTSNSDRDKKYLRNKRVYERSHNIKRSKATANKRRRDPDKQPFIQKGRKEYVDNTR